MTPTEKRAALATHIRGGKLITAPGVYDMISVRIADRQKHPALYMTGYGTVASYLGLPDAGLASYSDMVHRAGQMAAGSNTPIIADADTGYGGLLNVQHTIRGFAPSICRTSPITIANPSSADFRSSHRSSQISRVCHPCSFRLATMKFC